MAEDTEVNIWCNLIVKKPKPKVDQIIGKDEPHVSRKLKDADTLSSTPSQRALKYKLPEPVRNVKKQRHSSRTVDEDDSKSQAPQLHQGNLPTISNGDTGQCESDTKSQYKVTKTSETVNKKSIISSEFQLRKSPFPVKASEKKFSNSIDSNQFSDYSKVRDEVDKTNTELCTFKLQFLNEDKVRKRFAQRNKPEPTDLEEEKSRVVNKEVIENVFASRGFSDLDIHPYLVSNLRQWYNIEKMTVVQERAIPVVLEGRDVLIKSQTGSGKTLAYAIPIIHELQKMEPLIKRDSGLFAVIVVPTRELALQTYEWFHKLLKSFSRVVVYCFMGGQKRKSEKGGIRRGFNVLVTTPQRIIDHLDNSSLFSIKMVRWLVLDEADRLTEMGYERNINRIVEAVRKEVMLQQVFNPEAYLQVIMLSATLSKGVEQLAGLSLKSPAIVDCALKTDVAKELQQLTTPANLKQYFTVVPVKKRLVTLIAFVLWKCGGDRHKLLVFMPTQDMVDFHTKLLNHIVNEGQGGDPDSDEYSVEIAQLHSNMTQQERNNVFKTFRDAKAGVLLSTDLASRGLDVPRVHWIVQYSAPLSVTDYVHRVGRTARIGMDGNAVMFLLPSELHFIKHLQENNIHLTDISLCSIWDSLPRIQSIICNRKTKGKQKEVMQSTDEAAISLQLTCENAVKLDHVLRKAARKAFLSYVRFYSTYPQQIRRFFPFRELHLGHAVKSVALLDTPSALGAFRPEKMNQRFQRNTQPKIYSPEELMQMEYASGL